METKEEKTFYCKDNGHQRYVFVSWEWEETPKGVFAACPICEREVEEVPAVYQNYYKMWQNQTGPRTQEGKRRSSLNGYKHGHYSQVYNVLAPALPGKFPACQNCQYREPCENEPYKWCPVNIAPMVRFVKAYQEGNLAEMKEFAGMNQAKIFQTVQMMWQEIQSKGVLVPKEIRRKINEDAGEEEIVLEWQANPLLQRIQSFIEMLGHSADQQIMTPRAKEEDENIKGYLEMEDSKAASLEETMEKNRLAMAAFSEKIQRAMIQRKLDPALMRHKEQLTREEEEDEDNG